MQCQQSDITIKVNAAYNSFNNNQTVIDETTISYGTNYYKIFSNILLETELTVKGNAGNKIFVKHIGIRAGYDPKPIPEMFQNAEFTCNNCKQRITGTQRNFKESMYKRRKICI